MIQKHDQIEGWSRSLGWLRKDIGSHGNQLALLALGTFALSFGASHPGKAQNLLGSLNPGSRREGCFGRNPRQVPCWFVLYNAKPDAPKGPKSHLRLGIAVVHQARAGLCHVECIRADKLRLDICSLWDQPILIVSICYIWDQSIFITSK